MYPHGSDKESYTQKCLEALRGPEPSSSKQVSNGFETYYIDQIVKSLSNAGGRSSDAHLPNAHDFATSLENMHKRFLEETVRLHDHYCWKTLKSNEPLQCSGVAKLYDLGQSTISPNKKSNAFAGDAHHEKQPLVPQMTSQSALAKPTAITTPPPPPPLPGDGNKEHQPLVAQIETQVEKANPIALELRIRDIIDDIHGREKKHTLAEHVIFSHGYTGFITLLVLCEAALLGIDVQMEMDFESDRLKGIPNDGHPFVLKALHYSFIVFFLAEVLLRAILLRGRFFFPSCPDNKYWNYFDILLGLLCAGEFLPWVIHLRCFRAIRLLRVLRVVNVARGIKPLRKMVYALLHCISSLFWLVLLLFLLLYMFALAFMQGAATDLKSFADTLEGHDGSAAPRLLVAKAKTTSGGATWIPHTFPDFQTVGIALRSLLLIVLGFADWNHVMLPVMHTGWFLRILGYFFTLFFYFGFMNVATGLFVDSALQIANQDHDQMLKEEAIKEEEEMRSMKKLFQTADVDDDGNLTIDELRHFVQHPEVSKYLAALDLDISNDFNSICAVLDPKNEGYIKTDEFCSTIGRFRGEAKQLETILTLLEVRTASTCIQNFQDSHLNAVKQMESACERLNRLEARMIAELGTYDGGSGDASFESPDAKSNRTMTLMTSQIGTSDLQGPLESNGGQMDWSIGEETSLAIVSTQATPSTSLKQGLSQLSSSPGLRDRHLPPSPIVQSRPQPFTSTESLHHQIPESDSFSIVPSPLEV